MTSNQEYFILDEVKPKIKLNPLWMWRIIPIGVILAVRISEQVENGIFLRAVGMNVTLLVGWIAGWLLAEADHLIYATMCNPQELTCQRVKQEIDRKNWRKTWDILEETKGERIKLPIRNILTAFVMAGLGIWVVTSSGSLLAAGMVFGFGMRLFSEILTDPDYKKWYWVFAREFSRTEHQGILAAWAIGLIWTWIVLLRG